jgi:hypothetical protein
MEPRIRERGGGDDDETARHWTTLYFERRGLATAIAIRYGAIFAEHAVEREDSGGVDHALLKEMGIVLVGHRIKILKALHDALRAVGTEMEGEMEPPAPRQPPRSITHSVATSSSSEHVAQRTSTRPALALAKPNAATPRVPSLPKRPRAAETEERTRHDVQKKRKQELHDDMEGEVDHASWSSPSPPTEAAQSTKEEEEKSAVAAEDAKWNGDSDEEHSGSESEEDDDEEERAEGEASVTPHHPAQLREGLFLSLSCALSHGRSASTDEAVALWDACCDDSRGNASRRRPASHQL